MKKWTIILLTVVSLIVIINLSNKKTNNNNNNNNNEKGEITFLDYPNKLSKQKDTIEVTYIAWACSCANWLPTNYLEIPGYDTTENADDCIYIEANKKEIILPNDYHLGGRNNKIKLIGKYYEDKGISRDYLQPTSLKPKKAKVFKYSKIEVIKPYIIWDFSKNEGSTKTIKKEMRTIFD